VQSWEYFTGIDSTGSIDRWAAGRDIPCIYLEGIHGISYEQGGGWIFYPIENFVFAANYRAMVARFLALGN
jgi:hypothetical protein